MLDDRYKLNVASRSNDYELSLPIDKHWSDADNRVLFVLETVDSEDLRSRNLLHERSRTVLLNTLKYSLKQARHEHGAEGTFAFAAINFNNEKFFHKPKDQWALYRKRFAVRVKKGIEQLKPTQVVVFGDFAMQAMFPEIENAKMKRGWVFKKKIGEVKVRITPSLDLERLYVTKKTEAQQIANDADEGDSDGGGEDEGNKDIYGKANLLFYVTRNLTNALCKKHLYSLRDVVPKAVFIDTIERFDKLYAKMLTAERIALDTETKNLTSLHNAIHTMQIAFSRDKGFVLPIDHPQTPFKPEEIEYIKRKLRKFFKAEPGKLPLKYIITQYGMFDLRVLRSCLGIPVIFHPFWEVTAGEYCLDENGKYLQDAPFKTPMGNLQQIFCNYDNDHYLTAKFKKTDRSDNALCRLDNPDYIVYTAVDVQSIFGIHEMQIERARHLTVGDKPFLPFFLRLVRKQMDNTVHVISHMSQVGSHIDMYYLTTLKSKESPLLKLKDEVKEKLFATPEVKAANKQLLKESSSQKSNRGLFGKSPWLFGLTKPDHRQMLFFNVMGLKPVSFTPATHSPQVDKRFIEHYDKEQPIVEQFGVWTKLDKLWSTYVKGWWNKMHESEDSRVDNFLRPIYDFFVVVTGRLNSSNPSLHQTPTRGKAAKYIKRAFVARVGSLLIVFDFSAHEVRVWSYVAFDFVLAHAFRVGQRLRQIYRQSPLPETMSRLKKEGDIHIVNVKYFFGTWVNKDHPLRYAIKGVVFGVIYGKGAQTLHKDIAPKPREMLELRKKIEDLDAEIEGEKDKKKKHELKKKVLDLREQYKTKKLVRDTGVSYAKDLMSKLFTRFSKGAKWLKWTGDHAKEFYYTYSPIGMRRNLFGIMTGIDSIIAAMDRRAKNSPIQGFASQIGVTVARLLQLNLYWTLKHLGKIGNSTTKLPAEVEKMVHDAVYSGVPYEIILIYIHILQWVATYGVTEYYAKEFDFKFTIEPEIEMAVGASEDNLHTWDWSEKNLVNIIKESLEDQKKLGLMGKDETPESAFKKVWSAYKDSETRTYLEEHYPILNVRKGVEIEELGEMKEAA